MATAYLKAERIYLHSNSKTTTDLWIMAKTVVAVPPTDTRLLGQSVLTVLDGSSEHVAHPTIWKGHFDPMLQLAGVKTQKAFMNSCKCVVIEAKQDEVSFTPTRNLGVAGGFQPLDPKVEPIVCVQQDRLGDTLLSAFVRAES